MCGIVAVLCEDASRRRSVGNRMLDLIRWRGTEAPRSFDEGNVFLGCVRLPIVGGEAGAQPVFDAEWVLVFNGEIYNYRELAEEPSDTRACLRMLAEHGLASLNRAEGMYAIIGYDRRTGETWAARDPVGVKPLYLFRNGPDSYLASEIKCLGAAPGFDGRVEHLPPGHGWSPSRGMFPLVEPPWHNLPEGCLDPEVADRQLHSALRHAVAVRVPERGDYGVLVSGGLDSSLVAALAAESRSPRLIAVGFEGSADVAAARELAGWLGQPLTLRRLEKQEILAALPDIIWHLETPAQYMVANALPTFFAMEEASQHVRVTLGGDGADELFAGYPYLFEYFEADQLDRVLLYLLERLCTTELMRLDRMSMAHAVEAREPFHQIGIALHQGRYRRAVVRTLP